MRQFLLELFPRGDVPNWVVQALAVADIDVRDLKTAPSPEDTERAGPAAASANDSASSASAGVNIVEDEDWR